MSNQRSLEIVFGVIALLAVVSVPIPVRVLPHAPVAPAVSHLDLQRIEDLHRVTVRQREDLTDLTRETRSLAGILDAAGADPTHPWDEFQAALPRPEGTVGLPHRPRRPGMENPRYERPY